MDPLSSPGRPPRTGPVFIPDPSDFEQTVRAQLGDLGSGRDGFDALFAVPSGAIDSDTASLATFDEDVAAAAFNAGDFAKAYHMPVDAELPGFLSDGEALNARVQDPGAVEGAPVIVTPPNPPGTSGGTTPGGGDKGSGSLGSGIPGDGCEINTDLPWCSNWGDTGKE